jgi:hypothetical protein
MNNPQKSSFNISGTLLGLSFTAYSIFILSIIAPVSPSLQLMWQQIEKYIGTGRSLYMGIAGTVLLVLAIVISHSQKSNFYQKMEAHSENEKWLLALSAVYVQLSDVLEANDTASFYRIDMTRPWYNFIIGGYVNVNLQKNWGITDKASTLETLHQLLTSAQKDKEKSHIAWDGVRAVHVVRLACICSYISPEEAWQELRKIGLMLQKTFSSWKELNENFIKGRESWQGGTEDDMTKVKTASAKLLADERSPWNTLPWNTKL